MIVTLAPGADRQAVQRALAARGQWVGAVEHGPTSVHLVLASHSTPAVADDLALIDGVAAVSSPVSPHPRLDAQAPVVSVAGVPFGGARPVLIAGPCAVESADQIGRLAAAVADHGGSFLRGGAFKPRTSPYAFCGHGAPAVGWLRAAADAHGLRVVTEVLAEADVGWVADHADLIQVGSRNMTNFALLRSVGRTGRPVLLKRAMAATIEEWLLAAEHLLSGGAAGVVLCERGIRGFDGSTRNVLDLGAVAVLRARGLPVMVDPSHAAGRRDLILPLARAALAAGASGLVIEVHDRPEDALSDGPQALHPRDLAALWDRTHDA